MTQELVDRRLALCVLRALVDGHLYAAVVTYHCDSSPSVDGSFPLAVIADSLDDAERLIDALAETWLLDHGYPANRRYTTTCLMT